jgi:hypothetical protein
MHVRTVEVHQGIHLLALRDGQTDGWTEGWRAGKQTDRQTDRRRMEGAPCEKLRIETGTLAASRASAAVPVA